MKGLLKKIALLTLLFCFVFPFIPKAYAAVNLNDYTSMTLEEALKRLEESPARKELIVVFPLPLAPNI